MTPSGEMYGEGDWKADEEYRQGVREFSENRDAKGLTREAAEEMHEDKPLEGQKIDTEDDTEW